MGERQVARRPPPAARGRPAAHRPGPAQGSLGAAALQQGAGGRGCFGGAHQPRWGGVSPINTWQRQGKAASSPQPGPFLSSFFACSYVSKNACVLWRFLIANTSLLLQDSTKFFYPSLISVPYKGTLQKPVKRFCRIILSLYTNAVMSQISTLKSGSRIPGNVNSFIENGLRFS